MSHVSHLAITMQCNDQVNEINLLASAKKKPFAERDFRAAFARRLSLKCVYF